MARFRALLPDTVPARELRDECARRIAEHKDTLAQIGTDHDRAQVLRGRIAELTELMEMTDPPRVFQESPDGPPY